MCIPALTTPQLLDVCLIRFPDTHLKLCWWRTQECYIGERRKTGRRQFHFFRSSSKWFVRFLRVCLPPGVISACVRGAAFDITLDWNHEIRYYRHHGSVKRWLHPLLRRDGDESTMQARNNCSSMEWHIYVNMGFRRPRRRQNSRHGGRNIEQVTLQPIIITMIPLLEQYIWFTE